MVEYGLDRRLIERTIEVVKQKGGFGHRQLRAALDNSPLWGASRVEDTYNLLRHALRKVLSVIAGQQGWGLIDVTREAGASIVVSTSMEQKSRWPSTDPSARVPQLATGQLDWLTTGQKWRCRPRPKLSGVFLAKSPTLVPYPLVPT